MSLEREGARLFWTLMFSSSFWGIFACLLLLGMAIKHPFWTAGVVTTAVALFLGSVALQHRREQGLLVDGARVPIRKFECQGCGKVGTLRVEKRPQSTAKGAVQWPTSVCRGCGHEEPVPSRNIIP